MEVCSFCQELKTCTSFNYSVRASLLFALEITLGICRLQEYIVSKYIVTTTFLVLSFLSKNQKRIQLCISYSECYSTLPYLTLPYSLTCSKSVYPSVSSVLAFNLL